MPVYVDGERFGLTIGHEGREDRPNIDRIELEEPIIDRVEAANPVTEPNGMAAGSDASMASGREAAPPPRRPPLDIGRGAGIEDGIGIELWDFEERKQRARREGRDHRQFGNNGRGRGMSIRPTPPAGRAQRRGRGSGGGNGQQGGGQESGNGGDSTSESSSTETTR